VSDLRPIRTPFVQHLHRVRYQLVPVLVFSVGVFLTVLLWGRHVSAPVAMAEAEIAQVDIISQVDGVLEKLPDRQWVFLDPVGAGDLLARIDATPTQAMLETMLRDQDRLEKELTATEARIRQEQADRTDSQVVQAARLAVDLERLRLAVLDRRTQLEVDRIELKRRDELVEIVRKLLVAGLDSQFNLLIVQIPRDLAAQRVVNGEKALKEAEATKDEAQARRGSLSSAAAAAVNVYLDPVRAAIRAQEARVDELQIKINSLSMKSPIQGKISAIYRRPGEAVRAGDLVMTVAATETQHVISYIRQYQRIRPDVGMTAEVRTRSIPQMIVQAKVDRVGPKYEPIPPHQLFDPKVPEWGLPVRLAVPGDVKLRPGELVEVKFSISQ